MITMKTDILLEIADLIDAHNKDMCWSELVMWAFGYKSFWGLFCKWHDEYDSYRFQLCRKSDSTTPWAYCGKCKITGNWYK